MYTVNIYIMIEGKKFLFKCSKNKIFNDFDEAKREFKSVKDFYKHKENYNVEIKKILFQTINL